MPTKVKMDPSTTTSPSSRTTVGFQSFSLPKLRSGIKIKADQYKKEEAEDFAIWKAWDEGDGEVFWETELGKGRPGWHIECSTLSMKYLGGTLDIHSGGVDLIFPHHENEVAQSEAATGKKFVNYWIHCNHLIVEGKKMSKSLGNFYTLRDLLEKGHNPKTIRYVLLSTHYRKPLNFTFQNLESAAHIISKLEEFVETLNKVEWDEENPEIENLIAETRMGFEEAMDEDLNINMALASIFQLIRKVNKFIDEKRLSKKDAEKIHGFLKSIDEVLGIFGQPLEPKKLPEEAERLLLMREEARKLKDWKTADELRKKLEGMGLKIEDTSRGVQWMWKKDVKVDEA